MSNSKRRVITVGTVGLIALSALVIADETLPISPTPAPAPKPKIGSDTLNFETTVGSFKLLGSDEVPASGTLTFNFNGTVLVTGADAKVSTVGDVRREYEKEEFEKRIYFGKGQMTVSGNVRSVQFFGSDLKGTFRGVGIMRMYGEFDQKLNTGFYQFVGAEKVAWGTSGTQVPVPQQIWNQTSNDVKVRDN